MPRPTGPKSRRERPAKRALSREGVINAALEVLESEGLERVTMRRIAALLDTGAASLYVYVRNTAALHAELLDALLGQVELKPRGPKLDWRERLVRLLDSYTRVLFAHPSLARSAVSARPSGTNYLRLLETVLELLEEGRVPAARAAWGVDFLLQLATATAAEQATRGEDEHAEEDQAALRSAVRALSPRTHPRLAALGDALFEGSGEARMRWGFQAFIHGIAETRP